MAKISRQIGTTSLIVEIFIQNNSVTTGAGLTGLTSSSSGLTCYYKRNTGTASVSVSLTTATLGTFTSGGFLVVDGTNMPGVYELGIPNAALASGADSVVIYLQGATNMAPTVLEIELTQNSNQDGVRGGMTALPNASMAVAKNTALNNFIFPMYDTNGNPKTGLTVTGQARIDSASFASLTNSVTEVAFGMYTVNLAAADLNGKVIALRFSATGAQDTDVTIVTQG